MYEVHSVDLSLARSDDQPLLLIAPLRAMGEIVMFDIPAGASFRLKVGERNPFMTITRPFTFEPEGNDEANSGLFLSNGAQAATAVEIVVGLGAKNKLNAVLT